MRETEFFKICVGDKVWDVLHDWGIVEGLFIGAVWPIEVVFKSPLGYERRQYNFYGLTEHAIKRSLFWDEVKIVPPPSPPRKIKKTAWVTLQTGPRTHPEKHMGYLTSCDLFSSKEAAEQAGYNRSQVCPVEVEIEE